MVIDDSFKKAGAVPFKWEIRPGVPKVQQPKPKPKPPSSPSFNLRRSLAEHQQHKEQSSSHHRSCPNTPVKLRPPPAGFYFQPPPPELRSCSFRSTPRTRSEQCRFDRSIMTRPETVASGCFPGPLSRRKDDKKRMIRRHKPEFDPEPDYTSDLETLSRWSVSTRKSFSPFQDSPLSSSSFSSYQSSPQPVSDAEWAGFGLF